MREVAVRQCIPGRLLRAVAAGECMLELSRQGGHWRLGAAGDSFNTALYLRRLGAQVRYLTALGKDAFSEEMAQAWLQEGLDNSLLLRDAARMPGLYAIRTDERGERSFHYWRQDAAVRQLFRLPGIEAALRAAADCDLLYLTGITLSLFDAQDRRQWKDLASEVQSRGGTVAFDPNYRPQGWRDVGEARAAFDLIAPHVDMVLCTDGDERLLYGTDDPVRIHARWRNAGAKEVVLKRGAAGAIVFPDSGVVELAAIAGMQVVDTTGAGDSFNAAYLASRLQGGGMAEAASAGNELAGAVVQISGAVLPAHLMPASTPD